MSVTDLTFLHSTLKKSQLGIYFSFYIPKFFKKILAFDNPNPPDFQ